MSNLTRFGATRALNHPRDSFDAEELLKAKAPVAGTASVWRDIVAMADEGNAMAKAIVRIGTAMNAMNLANARGEDVPEWARETLSFLDEYQDDAENVEEAIAALSRVIN